MLFLVMMYLMAKQGKPKSNYTVFKRSDSGSYGVRFTLAGHPQFRIGLGTDDQAEAHEKAAYIYMETKIRAENGLLTGNASFDKLACDYIDLLFEEAKLKPKRLGHAKHAKATVERYFIPYFGNQTISTIHHHDLLKYLDWRKVFWTTGDGKDIEFENHERAGRNLRMRVRHVEASPSTLKREASFLRGVFKHAVREGHLKQGDIPKLELGRVPVTKRPSFTKDQYQKLLMLSEQRIAEVPQNPKLLYERFLLNNFIIIAAETGMRPGEMFNLNWGHIEGMKEAINTPMKEQEITILAYGKGRRPERFIPKRTSYDGFEGQYRLFKTQFGRWPGKDDPLFCNYLGKRIGSLNSSLNSLLKAADLLYDPFGEKYSTYSFRHSYATWQLQRSPPVSIYWLARNMRTSIEMIEKWYSDAVPEDQAVILRGDDEW
ncbi:site-specific integrase [Lentilitoribacter sp. Alg239-R112]|uniref:tyrosine-type recombinase/integrase n=1 Tax=Lentilitoribacter sp. Alg239-R112 TaxID=2305987 RepID=UPI0013A6AE2C|nr:site-specific integrase [Lentilitoribacter sp. Alg239-R112]